MTDIELKNRKYLLILADYYCVKQWGTSSEARIDDPNCHGAPMKSTAVMSGSNGACDGPFVDALGRALGGYKRAAIHVIDGTRIAPAPVGLVEQVASMCLLIDSDFVGTGKETAIDGNHWNIHMFVYKGVITKNIDACRERCAAFIFYAFMCPHDTGVGWYINIYEQT